MQRIRCDSLQKVKDAIPGLRKQLADEGAQKLPPSSDRRLASLAAESLDRRLEPRGFQRSGSRPFFGAGRLVASGATMR